MKTHAWQTILLIFAGIVIGSFAANLAKPVPALSFLTYGLDFGIRKPATLDLGIMTLTLGFTIKITITTILFVVLSIYFGRKIFK